MPEKVGKIIIRNYNALDQADYEERTFLKWAEEHVKANTFPAGPVDSPEIPGGVLLDLLCTVPGIGKITALIWLYTVCDPARFPNQKAAAAFSGCDPTLKVSAGKVTAHVRRGGNKDLHLGLVNAAMGLVNRGAEPIGRWGARLAAKPGKGQWRKAVGAVARRLAVGLYQVHMRAAPFSYEKYNLELHLSVPKIPITQCGFSKGCVERLHRQGITEAPNLVERFSKDLAKTKGIGKKTYEEVSAWVEKIRNPKVEMTASSKEA